MNGWHLAWRWWWVAVACLIVGAWVGGLTLWSLMIASLFAMGLAVVDGRERE